MAIVHSSASSLKVVQLLDQLHTHSLGQRSTSNCLIVGNPDTQKDRMSDLGNTEQEADEVSQTLGAKENEIYKKKAAEVSQIPHKMPDARWIFLGCHEETGHPSDLTDIDFHSVFEGCFRLAPDGQKNDNNRQQSYEKGYLLSRQIAEPPLKAESVFLSACYSGKGKAQKEGSFGPVWSFLAAGASSVVATYWPLPESPTTLAMIKKFYSGIAPKEIGINKAQALRNAVLEAIKEDRNDFIRWGAFSISGVTYSKEHLLQGGN